MSIELAWVGIAVTGLAASLWGVRDALADLRAVRNLVNGRRVIARGYLRGELVSAAIQAGLVVVGIGPLLDPEPVRPSPAVVILMAVNAGLLVRSLLDALDRLTIRGSSR